MPQVPSGTVTFLFTDIEGSTRRWETDAAAMRDALARHDEVLRSTIDEYGGHVFATGGDGFAVAFASVGDALGAATRTQQQLRESALPPVRMGLHTGEAIERGGDYFGPSVNRTARLMGIAHGGQVLVSGVTQRLATGVELRDLGEHRLRDLLQPERVFQLCVPGVDNDFGPLASLDALPTNLPVQLTQFVGRGEETASITRLLKEHRLVTITGVGGVGKTRLAVQCAAEVLSDFGDGVWLAELAQAEDDDALADVVAVALRAPSRPGVSALESIVEFLQPRELLLVVDNCEHLLSTASDLIERTLQSCPRVRVLATSREGLGIPGEHLWPLRSLPVPDVSASADDIRESDAVRLFVDRASALDPAFALDAENLSAVADICRRLDGIPLAVELAAARVGAMGTADIAARLDERFRLLTGGRRRAVERHQTLRAAVDWSYQLLDDTERIVFDRLGVFVGSFDAAAAQSVASGDGVEQYDVVDALTELVAKSMVMAEKNGGRSRYQLLETLRQFALEQLDSRGDTDEMRRRHAQYFAGVAEQWGPKLLGPDEIEARARIVVDLDNLRAAVGWAIEDPSDDAFVIAIRVVSSLPRETVLNRGAGIGGWAERVIDTGRAVDDPRWSVVVAAAGYSLYHRGELDAAYEKCRAALAATRATDLDTAVWSGMATCNITVARGDLAGGIAILEDLITWILPDRYDARIVYSIFSLFLSAKGVTPRSAQLATDALASARVGGQPSSLAIALYAHAMQIYEHAPDAARRECMESLGLTEAGASDVVFANTHGLLARIAETEDDRDAMRRLVLRSLEYANLIGDRPPMIDGMFTAARVFRDAGELEACMVVDGSLKHGWFEPMARIARPDHDINAETRAQARAELGDAAFEAARARGGAMSYDEIIAFTLSHLRSMA